MDSNNFDIRISDNKNLEFGDASNPDLYIKHSVGHNANFIVSYNGDIEHHMASSKKIIKGFQAGGSPYVALYHNNANRLQTTASGINFSGNLSSDSGGNFTINAGGASGTAAHFIARCGSENAIVAAPNGAVELYHNANKKLETTSSGISTDGLMNFNGTGDKILIGDNGKVVFGGGLDLQLFHDGSTSKIVDTTNGLLIRQINNGDVHIHAGASDAAANNRVVGRAAGQAELYYNGSKKFETRSDGTKNTGLLYSTGNVLPWGDNTQDLGSTSNRWINIYTNDLQLSNEGHSNDVDGTWGSWTIQEGE